MSTEIYKNCGFIYGYSERYSKYFGNKRILLLSIQYDGLDVLFILKPEGVS